MRGCERIRAVIRRKFTLRLFRVDIGPSSMDAIAVEVAWPGRELPHLAKLIVRTVQFGTAKPFFPSLWCIYRGDEQSLRRALLWPLGKKQWNMTDIANKPIPKLNKAPQPPLSHRGATPDSDRAKKPPLAEPSATDQELNPGDRVEGLGNFGMPTGEFGTVEQANEDDAVVKWDDDGRMRLGQPWLKKV